MDICQSVMANFFVRAAAGPFDFKEPNDLTQFLLAVMRNKVAEKCDGSTASAAISGAPWAALRILPWQGRTRARVAWLRARSYSKKCGSA